MSDNSVVQIGLNNIKHVLERYNREFNKDNIEIVNYDLQPYSKNPQGFLSNHFFLIVRIKFETKTAVAEDKITFFTKLAPSHSEALSQYVADFNVFEKETEIYVQLLPHLQGINANVPFMANCYLANIDFLVFEDLCGKQFRLGTKKGGILDYDHLRVALKSLASMHSASIVFENRIKTPLPYLYPKCLKENSYPEGSDNLRVNYVKMTIKTLCSLVPLIPKYKEMTKISEITNKLAETLDKIFSFVKPSNKFRNVVSHGDLWANNLLFRYGPRDGQSAKPVECRLVDFQLARYAPPMLDVMVLLTIPTTSSFRQKNLQRLLNEYYEFLKDFLADHDIDIETEIPKKEYNESIVSFKLAGLIESVLFSHITLLPPKFAKSLCQNSNEFAKFLSEDKIKICIEAFKTDDIYRDRLTDMLCEIIENYVLSDFVKNDQK